MFLKINLAICSCKIIYAEFVIISRKTLVNLDMHNNLYAFVLIKFQIPKICTFNFTSDHTLKTCRSGLTSIKQVNIDSHAYN